MDVWETIIKVLAAIGGAVLGLLGGWSPLLTALCVFMVVDYLTGILVGIRGLSPKTQNGKLSSKAGFQGLTRKAGIIVIVFMGALLDRAIGNGGAMFGSMCTCYFVANEGISIVENLVLLGVDVPDALKNALEIMQKKSKDDEPKK